MLCPQCVHIGNQGSYLHVNKTLCWPLRVHRGRGVHEIIRASFEERSMKETCELDPRWGELEGGEKIASLKLTRETAHNQCLLWYKPVPLLASYNMLRLGTSHCPDLVQHVLSHSTPVTIAHFTLCNSDTCRAVQESISSCRHPAHALYISFP